MSNKKWTLTIARTYFKNNGYELLSETYLNTHKRMILKDEIGYFYMGNIHSLQAGQRFKTFNQLNPYTLENIKLWCKLNDKPFELVSKEYIRASKKLEWKCLKDNCGKLFEVCWNSILGGHGCSKCGNKLKGDIFRLTLDEVKYKLTQINNNVEILSDKYIDAYTFMDVRCKIDGYTWKSTWGYLSQGNGCKICSNKLHADKFKLTLEEVKERLKKINSNIEILSDEYINNSIKLKCKCLVDGNIWYAKWNNLVNNKGCPICNSSKGEKEISTCLQNNKIEFIPQKTFKELRGAGNGLLSYDFYLPKLNLLLEYQGKYHDGTVANQTEEQFRYQKEHDRRKKEYAHLNNIELLEIWYWDYNNIKTILNQSLKI